MIRNPSPTDDPALKYARLLGASIRSAEQLLAASADCPRMSRAAWSRAGIHPADFPDEPTNAIASVVYVAGDATNGIRPYTPDTIALACRQRLIECGGWDATNSISAVGGRFGPGPLARLLSAAPFDPATIAEAIRHFRVATQNLSAFRVRTEAA